MLFDMSKIVDAPLDTVYYGYKYNKDGFHSGRSFPLKTAHDLMKYVNNWYDKCPEIRITDIDDMLCLHIKDGKIIYPTEKEIRECNLED